MPQTRPDLPFLAGVCGACTQIAARAHIDWTNRAAEWNQLVASAKNYASAHKNDYDVVVGVSGGKDSQFEVRECLRANLRPLGVCFEPTLRTEPGTSNLVNLARFCDIIEIRKNRDVYRRIQQIALREVGDAEWPGHRGIFCGVLREAVLRNIPLVIFGESPQAEYGPASSLPRADRDLDARWIEEHGGGLGLRPRDLIDVHGLRPHDVALYVPPDLTETNRVGLRSHFLGYFHPWDTIGQVEIVEREMGFRRADGSPYTGAWWSFENLDDSVAVAFHDFLALEKFGFTRAAAQLSIEIRHGYRTRAEAVEILRVIGDPYPLAEEAAFCDAIGMPHAEVRAICAAYVNPAIWDGADVLRLRRRPGCEIR